MCALFNLFHPQIMFAVDNTAYAHDAIANGPHFVVVGGQNAKFQAHVALARDTGTAIISYG